MEIQRKHVAKRYSRLTIYNGTAYFAMTPLSPYDATDSIVPQAKQIFERVEERLKDCGSTKHDLLFVTVILSDKRYLSAFHELWDAWVSEVSPPSRACFFAELTHPDLKVELIIQARAQI